jgi:hypothetical protein
VLARAPYELAEQSELAFAMAFFGVGDAVGELVELGRRVAFAGRDRLLSPKVLGNATGVAARDLDVPAEHARVADFQRRDPGRLAQARFELHHVLRAGACERRKLVEL